MQFFINWWIGSTAEWGAQRKELLNLKKPEQKLSNLNKSKMTDWKQTNKTQSLRNMGDFTYLTFVSLESWKNRRNGWWWKCIWTLTWKLPKFSKRYNLTDSRSWTNAKQNKLKETTPRHIICQNSEN